MVLLLRKQAAQTRLEGGSGQWSDNDYAVVEDTVIGRIHREIGGPQGGRWLWFLNMLAMPGDRTGVVMRGCEPSLDAAKAALKVEYERWKARR
jgi:hypothetical protein